MMDGRVSCFVNYDMSYVLSCVTFLCFLPVTCTMFFACGVSYVFCL